MSDLTPDLRDKLRDLILKSGKKNAELSKAAGRGETYVRDFLENPAQDPGLMSVMGLLRALKVDPADFFGDGHVSSEDVAFNLNKEANVGLPYGGTIEAGTFRQIDNFNQDGETRVIDVPMHPGYPRARQYVFDIRGDSLDLLDIKDGMKGVVADYDDFLNFYGMPGAEMPIVVRRTRNDGSEYEQTVKLVKRFKDRLELVPKSSNPKHETITVPISAAGSILNTEVSLIGVLLWAGRVFK